MLQQTQVSRVVPKFLQFTSTYPTNAHLADASLGDVLRSWQGLGYNRRAKFLLDTAQRLQVQYGGEVPYAIDLLRQMPGIGHNTAAAILAYVYDEPAVYLETNIRTVFLHHFFANRNQVPDRELLPLVQEALKGQAPREWYWALMDYGSHLKTTVGNVSRLSKHYTKQGHFEGSRRQLRGAVLRVLAQGPRTVAELTARFDDSRLAEVLDALKAEHMIVGNKDTYSLPEHD